MTLAAICGAQLLARLTVRLLRLGRIDLREARIILCVAGRLRKWGISFASRPEANCPRDGSGEEV